ncbi:MAG TPA: tripartite tricarboxylate transporter TctB family protein [Rubrivivax sp.]|nr:tripartite tricarboxylate transporter TctB family protein [Rubrivivax sp.]
MKIKSQKDFWSGLMFIVTGLGFAAGATNYSFGSSARPGPGYFPFGLGILLAILGAVVLFKALTVETPGGDKIGAMPFRPMALIILSVVVFGLALPPLGMAVSLPILIIVCSLAGDEFKWKDAILSCIVLTVGSWLVFIKGLGLVIPLWPAFLTT